MYENMKKEELIALIDKLENGLKPALDANKTLAEKLLKKAGSISATELEDITKQFGAVKETIRDQVGNLRKDIDAGKVNAEELAEQLGHLQSLNESMFAANRAMTQTLEDFRESTEGPYIVQLLKELQLKIKASHEKGESSAKITFGDIELDFRVDDKYEDTTDKGDILACIEKEMWQRFSGTE